MERMHPADTTAPPRKGRIPDVLPLSDEFVDELLRAFHRH